MRGALDVVPQPISVDQPLTTPRSLKALVVLDGPDEPQVLLDGLNSKDMQRT